MHHYKLSFYIHQINLIFSTNYNQIDLLFDEIKNGFQLKREYFPKLQSKIQIQKFDKLNRKICNESQS